jgi:outer membrane protein TolC
MNARQFCFRLIALSMIHGALAFAQQPQAGPTGGITLANPLPLSGRATQNGSVTPQQSEVPGTTQSVNTLNATVSIQGSYGQSVLSGKPLEGKLSLREAVGRGIAYNLGAIGLNNSSMQAHGQMRVARSSLLPNLNGSLREVDQQNDLAAQGLRVPFIPAIVGPYNYFDLRATLNQSVADLAAWNNYRSAQENLKAAQLAQRDARDLVVLAVGGAYLQVIAAQARVEAGKAQVETAKAVYEQTKQRREVGLNAQIDVNRNLVEYQTQQQRLTTLQNDLAKQKINLLRIIGLPASMPLELADSVPFAAAPGVTYEDAVHQALDARPDVKSAEAAYKAAQRTHTAAKSERLPSLAVEGDYGLIGTNPAQSHGTFSVTGTVRFPIWQGGRTEGDIEQATASLNQRSSELSEVRGRVESDVRNAFLDLDAATSQLEVAESNRKVAQENLDLTRQRLEAGIADSVEVTQAQETAATAELDYITSLLSHNLAKLSLAKALGNPEEKLAQFLSLP